MVGIDHVRILDHRRFPVCWHHRRVPFWRWWGRIRIVSVQLKRPESAKVTYTDCRVRSMGQYGEASYEMVLLPRELPFRETIIDTRQDRLP